MPPNDPQRPQEFSHLQQGVTLLEITLKDL